MRRVEAAPDSLQPRVEADCTLEWITLKEKKRNRAGLRRALAWLPSSPPRRRRARPSSARSSTRPRSARASTGCAAASRTRAAPRRARPAPITGFVKRSDGRNTVWIDGTPVPVANPKAAAILDPRSVRAYADRDDAALKIERKPAR